MNTAAATTERAVFIDGLRILALGLLIPYHVGMYYASWGWHIKSPHASTAVDAWLLITGPWRMSLLFLVSGCATAWMLHKRPAPTPLLRERAGKLLWPLLFGVLVTVPPQAWLEVRQRFGYAGGPLDFMALYLRAEGSFCDARGCLILPTWNHLWFLPYLFTYTAVLCLILRRWPGALDRAAVALPRALAGWRLWMLPIAWLLAVRWGLGPLFPPTHALIDDPTSHALYLPAFLLGATLARHGGMWVRLEALRWPALALALAAYAVVLAGNAGHGRGFGSAVQQWAAIVAALGFAHRHLHRASPAQRWLSQAVYPVYLLHQTLIIVMAAGLAGWDLPPGLEAVVLVGGTLGLGLALFEAVRRWPAARLLRRLLGMAATAPPLNPGRASAPLQQPASRGNR